MRCTRGAIYDVVLDLRPDSHTFKEWIAVVLTADKRNMIYVPEGCAHGFLTLEDDTEVFYQMSEFYNAESARGVRWDDPAFRIAWPGESGSDFGTGPNLPELRISAMRLARRIRSKRPGRSEGVASVCEGPLSDLPEHHRRRNPANASLHTGPHSAADLTRCRQERRCLIGPYPKNGTFETPTSSRLAGNGSWTFRTAIYMLNYSTPVRATMPLSELKPHLFTIPEKPDWIPYRTSYYKEDWGFCLSHDQMLAAGRRLRSLHRLHSSRMATLTYGECYLGRAIRATRF